MSWSWSWRAAVVLACAGGLSIAAAPAPRVQVGIASWYGSAFAGRETTSGQRFNPNLLTAASRSLPLGSIARVTNLRNGRRVLVLINDRGPYYGRRIIDLSRAAAGKLRMIGRGIVRVRVRWLLPPGRRARRIARHLRRTALARR